MAAEFSRELGDKVFRGKSRLVQLGLWVGGMPGYVYRRLMVSANGKPKQMMSLGESKSLTTDRVVLIPGPRKEIECVRHMYSMVIEGRHGAAAIARDLNHGGMTIDRRPWQRTSVINNPKYTGCNVWHRSPER